MLNATIYEKEKNKKTKKKNNQDSENLYQILEEQRESYLLNRIEMPLEVTQPRESR